VGAKPDRARRVARLQHADHAGLADAPMHFDAEAGEPLGDEAGGAFLVESELRMRVEIAAPRRQLVVVLAQARDQWHGSTSLQKAPWKQPVIASAAKQSSSAAVPQPPGDCRGALWAPRNERTREGPSACNLSQLRCIRDGCRSQDALNPLALVLLRRAQWGRHAASDQRQKRGR